MRPGDRSGAWRESSVLLALFALAFAAFLALVLAYGPCATWDVTAPPPDGCRR